MKKTIKPLLLSSLLMIGGITFSQNGENGKQTANQTKPVVSQAAVKNENSPKAKPASSLATVHPKVLDKKSVSKQNNSSKK